MQAGMLWHDHWYKADNPTAPAFVRYSGNSGHRRIIKTPNLISERPLRGGLSVFAVSRTSAFDMLMALRNVRL
jgi:hypothetical protein